MDASGEGGGRIFIRGGELVAENALIQSHTRGAVDGRGIDIEVTGELAVRNGARIETDTSGPGRGGNVTVAADNLEVRNGIISANLFHPFDTEQLGSNVTVTEDSVFLSGDGAFFTGIFASGGIRSHGEPTFEVVRAGAGNITVTAGKLEMRNGAEIRAFGGSDGGGNVTVTADRAFLSGDGAILTGIFAEAAFGAVAGNVTVTAGSLEMRNGAEISASFFAGLGQGGNVTINATDITLQDGGRISAESIDADQKADAGNITLKVGNLLHLSNDSSITTSVTGGTGKGGTSPSILSSSCSMRVAELSPMLRGVKGIISSFVSSVEVPYFSHPIAGLRPPPRLGSKGRW